MFIHLNVFQVIILITFFTGFKVLKNSFYKVSPIISDPSKKLRKRK